MPKNINRSLGGGIHQARQGDVFITTVKNIPEGAKRIPCDARGRIILAAGEQHGHFHAIPVLEQQELCTAYELNGKIYLHVETPDDVTLEHEEHDAFQLERGGFYRSEIQRCYDPLGAFRVQD
jgi:hypothetical protein